MSTSRSATPGNTDPIPPPRNTDRVTPPVLTRAAIVGLVGVAAAFGLDLNISEEQAGVLSDLSLVLLPLLATLAGSVWGALRAREGVTPIGPNDTPRNADGVELVPGSHAPTTGYPRKAPRVDRRGIDRDRG
jgi:hypothetical protein